MTWRKGFFRAWVVLSVMWIGFSVFVNDPKTYPWLWHAPQYEIKFPSGHTATFDTSKSHEEIFADVTRELQDEAARIPPAAAPPAAFDPDAYLKSGAAPSPPPGFTIEPNDLSVKRDQFLSAINSMYETPGEKAQRVWQATFVPPLALLGLGLCIAWIGRGFRARR